MWRRITACAFAALALYGCGNGRRAKQVPKTNEPEKSIQAEATARGISILWSEKTESGGIHKVIEAQAEEGAINAEKKSSELKKASGTLYKENKPKAHLTAEIVRGDENKHVVVATGNVTVTSIDPPGYTMKTKRATWNAIKDTITAEGDVYFTFQRPGDSTPSASIGPCPRAVFRTELKTYTIWNQ